jgi:hypothetical protein
MLQYKILSIVFFTVGTLSFFYSKKFALMSLEKTDREFNRPFDEEDILLHSLVFKFMGILSMMTAIYTVYRVAR